MVCGVSKADACLREAIPLQFLREDLDADIKDKCHALCQIMSADQQGQNQKQCVNRRITLISAIPT